MKLRPFQYQKLLVQVDIEQVKFVNVINIDHLQIVQSKINKLTVNKRKRTSFLYT